MGHRARVEFVERYEPLLRRWCRGYGLDDQAADELCMRTWERLWPRMRTFQYDPSRRFRSWLRRFFHSRAMDELGERAATAFVPLDALSLEDTRTLAAGGDDISMDDGDDDDECQSSRPVLIREGKAVQEFVQSQVDPATWQAYWLTTIAIDGLSVKEVATRKARRTRPSITESSASSGCSDKRVSDASPASLTRRTNHPRTVDPDGRRSQ